MTIQKDATVSTQDDYAARQYAQSTRVAASRGRIAAAPLRCARAAAPHRPRATGHPPTPRLRAALASLETSPTRRPRKSSSPEIRRKCAPRRPSRAPPRAPPAADPRIARTPPRATLWRGPHPRCSRRSGRMLREPHFSEGREKVQVQAQFQPLAHTHTHTIEFKAYDRRGQVSKAASATSTS